jgi:hypothetical protein
MDALSLAVGIILMLVAAVGTVLYVALVIAIPVCRVLDWLFQEDETRVARPSWLATWTRSVTRRTMAVARHIRGHRHRTG